MSKKYRCCLCGFTVSGDGLQDLEHATCRRIPKGKYNLVEKDIVAESPAAMAGSSARCDEADHVLVKIGIAEYGMTAKKAFELASDIHGAAFIAAHKAGFKQGQ